MVGVPALIVWPSGTSSWMGWPIFRRVSAVISSLVPTMVTSVAMPAARTSRITARSPRPETWTQRGQLLAGRRHGRRTVRCGRRTTWPCLVALAGDQHDVARVGRDRASRMAVRRSGSERGPSAQPEPDLAPMMANRILGPGVVGGEHDPVGQLAGHPAHDRALGRVAVTAAAEHDDAPARRRPAPGRRRAPARARRGCGRSRRPPRTPGRPVTGSNRPGTTGTSAIAAAMRGLGQPDHPAAPRRRAGRWPRCGVRRAAGGPAGRAT